MQSDNRIFDDMAKLASSSFGNILNAKKEMDNMLKQNVQRFMEKTNFAPRSAVTEEIEVLREVAVKTRTEQERLEKKVAELESRIAKLESGVK